MHFTHNLRVFSQLEQACAWREELRAQGRRLVITNGVFDLLHVGHVRYLAQARALGDALLILVNDDDSVRALKGPTRPVHALEARAEVLAHLESVDGVLGFSGQRCSQELLALQPDVYAKGGDYTPESLHHLEKAALDKVGASIQILPLVAGHSTSSTVKKMVGSEVSESGKTTNPVLKLGVLGSGSGSNLAAIFSAIDAGKLCAEVSLVISDKEEAKILHRAKERGIPAIFVDPGPKRTLLGASAQKEIRDRLVSAGVDLVILAGFMRLVKSPLLDEFEGKMLNIHPSLLPKFPGLHAWKQAFEAGEAESGCTVHLVDAGMDTGPILAQARVPVNAQDNATSLHERIQVAEHELYPEVIGNWGNLLRNKGCTKEALKAWHSSSTNF